MIDSYIAEGEKKLQESGIMGRYGANRGNSTRITRDYLDSMLIEMRVIGSVPASTEFKLFGETFASPVMTAALSGLKEIHPDGMVEVARGAAAARAVMWTGIGDDGEITAIARTGARAIKIIKPYADNALIHHKIKLSEKLGLLAVGMDVDYVFGGKNKRGFAKEFPVSPKSLDDIKGFIKASGLPFILKGILSEQDAEKALEAGAGGIVVSHHGGSVLDYAVPPLMILPKIRKIAGEKFPIFVDCSIVSGADVFKAIALGAGAASLGRAVMAGLAAGGAEGVRKVIEGVNEDLRAIMSLTGAASICSVSPDILTFR
ncbi:MAG: alpha-hydroxy-acid oxidizing protein [Synergistaceae bacterium]|jgi:isopentenyl diphosphate isomerase/L-lactate dehydrogenase-like FMN-dependent dehydrogenase|nr:alpha-hydroxy-acid oxidizing protein [Synergistaceae bacterium]